MSGCRTKTWPFQFKRNIKSYNEDDEDIDWIQTTLKSQTISFHRTSYPWPLAQILISKRQNKVNTSLHDIQRASNTFDIRCIWIRALSVQIFAVQSVVGIVFKGIGGRQTFSVLLCKVMDVYRCLEGLGAMSSPIFVVRNHSVKSGEFQITSRNVGPCLGYKETIPDCRLHQVNYIKNLPI
jgi:hypothetical protein